MSGEEEYKYEDGAIDYTEEAIEYGSPNPNEARAALARVKALIDGWQGGTGHTDSNRFVSVADIKAALKVKP